MAGKVISGESSFQSAYLVLVHLFGTISSKISQASAPPSRKISQTSKNRLDLRVERTPRFLTTQSSTVLISDPVALLGVHGIDSRELRLIYGRSSCHRRSSVFQ